MDMELFDLIRKLTCAYGPSGDEGEVRELIAALAAPYADEVTVDTMGSLVVHRSGKGPRVMLAAHMDSIGFIVTHIEEEGFLRCGRLGGVSPREAAYVPVRFRNGVQGVFAKEEKAEFGKLKLDECYIDIGAKSRQEAERMVQVGDTAVYHVPAFSMGDKVVSPYLDNRISCAVLLRALEQLDGEDNDLYFVFTVQEEVGLRGAKTAAYSVSPDYGVVLDVTDVDDTPASEKNGTVQLGKGAAVKVMDSSVICHPKMVERLTALAREQRIPVQRDIMRGGGTDAGAMLTTCGGVITGGISVPCRYIHTPSEMADLADAAACVRLVRAFAQTDLTAGLA